METILGRSLSELDRVEFFTSHEGLHLHYEQAQTRQVPRHPGWYNLSTHFPWIGDRTRALDGAHLEYFRGIGCQEVWTGRTEGVAVEDEDEREQCPVLALLVRQVPTDGTAAAVCQRSDSVYDVRRLHDGRVPACIRA